MYNDNVGISPALNVDLSSVLFTSLVAGTDGAIGAEYKLTLFDSNKHINLQSGQSVTRIDDTVTVPYRYMDERASDSSDNVVNQISVMITDKPYTGSGAKLLY